MIESQLSDSDIRNARAWLSEHRAHVERILKASEIHEERFAPYPPSGSDKRHPELWKTLMWRWFINKFGVGPAS